ncbi:hypothetical protein GAN98_10355 [Bacteroides thetaiotaomicron]|uniref:Uncharacterized protein n=1 Tax=Bacteroides thetaiotaomicron TaxID=818 RepID=A0A412GMZ2_BACT4|nr:hypothetical protein FIB20_11425 [Bacteroides thetaiotaomicron]RGC84874.1 hypothetical protein DW640_12480 [Bacteroides sp. AM23-12]KAA0106614.1 hypothetical protein FIA61_02300 [Bacteroides thetaiotaomicron]KAB4416076.1 hypothetical protein GAN94_21710 [Bacteroides thetaiotaomicron]KAB4428533.1 hypothetical protein GAO03_17665 [Bacteroides thetaiotaomicron]
MFFFPNQLDDNSFFWSISSNSFLLCTLICASTSRSSFFNEQNNSSLNEFSIKTIFINYKKAIPESTAIACFPKW